MLSDIALPFLSKHVLVVLDEDRGLFKYKDDNYSLGVKSALCTELLQCPHTIYLLLNPILRALLAHKVFQLLAQRWFPPLHWVSLPVQWWPVALKTQMHGARPRWKAEGQIEGDAGRQVPSPETPHVQREACAPWTQRKDGVKGVLTKGVAFTGFATC